MRRPTLSALVPFPRQTIIAGLAIGATFGLWNLVGTMLDPLAEDTPRALLAFYGPMFFTWGAAAFVAARRTHSLPDAVKVGAAVAFVTFLVYDIAVVVRVNFFLDAVSRRSDWRNVMMMYEASGFESLRAYVNYMNVVGTPFKLLVATAIGATMGLAGGLAGGLVGVVSSHDARGGPQGPTMESPSRTESDSAALH